MIDVNYFDDYNDRDRRRYETLRSLLFKEIEKEKKNDEWRQPKVRHLLKLLNDNGSHITRLKFHWVKPEVKIRYTSELLITIQVGKYVRIEYTFVPPLRWEDRWDYGTCEVFYEERVATKTESKYVSHEMADQIEKLIPTLLKQGQQYRRKLKINRL